MTGIRSRSNHTPRARLRRSRSDSGGEASGRPNRMAAIGTPLEHIAGARWTSADFHGLAVPARRLLCREIAESACQTRLTRNEGVPVRVRASASLN
jgi:hypothetical protein